MKYPQAILTVASNMIGSANSPWLIFENRISLEEFVLRAEASLFLGRREELESDDRYRQLLPYVAIIIEGQDDGFDEVVFYQRVKGHGEQRLGGKHSIGFGGHIDLEDIKHTNSVIDLRETILSNLKRELNEELVLDGEIDNWADSRLVWEFRGLINDLSDNVGRHHLGIAFVVRIPADHVVRSNEIGNVLVGNYEPNDLMNGAKYSFEMENWTKIFLRHLEECTDERGRIPYYGTERRTAPNVYASPW